jgi:hypothetical protein
MGRSEWKRSLPAFGTWLKGTRRTVLEGSIVIYKIPFSAQTSETDTGFDLPDKCEVLDVLVDVQTSEAGRTIDVGLLSSESGGDADGFIVGLSIASTGLARGQAETAIGTYETYWGSNTRGALMSDYVAGSDSAGDHGLYNEKPHLSDSVTAKSVSYSCSAGTLSAAGYIYLVCIVGNF